MTEFPNLFEVEARMGRISAQTYEAANKEADAALAGVVFCYLVGLSLFSVGVYYLMAKNWSSAASFILFALFLHYGYLRCRDREHKFRLISLAYTQRDALATHLEDFIEETPTKILKIKH